MPNLEDYLTGIPVSAENEALLKELDGEIGPEDETARLDWNRTGALDKNERKHLRRLTGEPGFPILVRLLANCIEEREAAAKLVSANPLENQQAMVSAWTYVAAIKSMRAGLLSRIEAETAGVSPANAAKEED